MSNVESLLSAILTGKSQFLVVPQSRVEELLYAIYENGGTGGGGGVAGIKYLGVIDDLTKLSTTAKKGDYYLSGVSDTSKNVHVGDMLIAQKDSPAATIDNSNYRLLHTEMDSDTTYTLTQDNSDGHILYFKASTETGTGTKITIPDNDTDNDKKTSSANLPNVKLYLIGAETQTTTGVTTYSNSNVYIDSSNRLCVNNKPVLTSHITAAEMKLTSYDKGTTKPESIDVTATDSVNDAFKKVSWALDEKVNTSRKINDKDLSADVTLAGNDVKLNAASYTKDTTSKTISKDTKVDEAVAQLEYRTDKLTTDVSKKANETTISSVDSEVSVNTVPECLGYAGVKMIGGKTEKSQNLLKINNISPGENSGVTFTPYFTDEGYLDYIDINGTASGTNSVYSFNVGNIKASYYGGWSNNLKNMGYIQLRSGSEWLTNCDSEDTVSIDNTKTLTECWILVAEGYTANHVKIKPYITNDPSMNYSTYEPHYEGLHSAPVEKIVSKFGHTGGFVTGITNPYTGDIEYLDNYITTDNFISCKQGDIISVSSEYPYSYIAFYNSSKSFISRTNKPATAPNNAVYFKVTVGVSSSSGAINPNDHKPVEIYINGVNSFKNEISLAEITKNLPDYGCSAGSVYNVLDLQNMKYYRNIKSLDLSTLDEWESGGGGFVADSPTDLKERDYYAEGISPARFICEKYNESRWNNITDKCVSLCPMMSVGSKIIILDSSYTNPEDFAGSLDGAMLYYELATPEVYDLTSILAPIPCEQGGTITLQNTHSLDVPNTICYKKEV